MKLKILHFFLCVLFACDVYSQSEHTEVVPPSALLRYDTGNHHSILLAIGHKPIGKKDSFAGIYYEKDSITDFFTVTSLGVIAFNFSRQETPNDGAELRIGLSKTDYSGQVRRGIDIGLVLHKYVSSSISIGVGGVIRPTILSYESDNDNMTEYKMNVGVYYTVTDYLKLSAQYRYDGVLLEDGASERVNDGFQANITMLF